MKEIKFRGKSKNTDKQQLVYGWGCYRDENDRLFILQDEPVPMNPVQVVEIQQFTGIKDKNGKEVYEGDIILFQDEPKYKSTWEVKWHNFGFRLVDGIGYRLIESETYPKVSENGEIIGNIFDNK